MANTNKDTMIGKKVKPVPIKQKEIGIDTNSNFLDTIIDAMDMSQLDISSLENFNIAAQSRESVYQVIDTMAMDDRVAAVLDSYTEDTIQTNDAGHVVWCESSDTNVGKYVTYLLDTLNVDKYIEDWVYSLIEYGDVYLRLRRESDIEEDLLFDKKKTDKQNKLNEALEISKLLNDDSEESKKLQENIKVYAHQDGDRYVPIIEKHPNPAELFELTKYGKTMGFIKCPTMTMQKKQTLGFDSYINYKMKQGDITLYDATDFVHGCLIDKSNRTPEKVNIYLDDKDMDEEEADTSYVVRRGQSILYNSFKSWRELSLLENSVLLNRLTKSALVRILNVDVGDMPKNQINNFIARLKQKIEQKSAISVGNSMQEYTNPGPIENVIYIPTHEGKGTITASALGGDVDVKSLADLDYYLDKFYGTLGTLKQYFGVTGDSTGFNGGTSLTILSSRYGKKIKRIQNVVCQMITDLVNLFLYDRGLTSYLNRFVIKMQTPITQEELDRREDMRNRIGTINEIMSQVNAVIKDEIIQAKMLKTLLSESVSNPEIINLCQEYINQLEKAKSEEQEEEESSSKGGSRDEGESVPSFARSEEPMEEPSEVENEPIPELGGEEEGSEEGGEEDSFLPSPSEMGLDLTGNQ